MSVLTCVLDKKFRDTPSGMSYLCLTAWQVATRWIL